MIEIKFTGESVPEVVGQMLAFIEETRPQPVLEPRKRGRPPKEPVETTPVEPITDDEPDQVEEPETMTADAIANEKMKQEIVATLSDMYTAGKVKFVRGLLAKYGDGAKTFHEIDASVFPQIREAMANGEAS